MSRAYSLPLQMNLWKDRIVSDAARIREMYDQGSHFYRTDLQVHSPRDNQWAGKKYVSDDDRMEYARSFVAACRDKGLHAVAITDHHDMVFVPFIRKAAAEELDSSGLELQRSSRLVVFPGVELTLALARQALLILDADFPEEQFSQVLQALAITLHPSSEPSLPSVQTLDHIPSLTDLHRRLDEQAWLRGRYIVLPNVTDKGHKTILRKGMHAEYIDMPCVGGYLDGSIAKLGLGNQNILSGADASWGNKRLAVFQTSDSRSATHDALGVNSTWIKWVRPTAEALRQACLAQESRLSQGEPAIPSVWISKVHVSNSKFMGRVDVHLNPQYNALIGGRGTGKSTVMDYLRWALCDQPAEATQDDEVADPRVRQRRLIEATLKPLEAQVEVHFTINGISHAVRRHASNGSVQLKVADADFEDVAESTVQSLLPIQAYSQKQLSSVAIRVKELLRFVTSPIQAKLEAIDRQASEIEGRLRENYGTLQRFRLLTASIERSQLRARSLGEQSDSLRGSLAGLTEADKGVLGSKNAHDLLRARAVSWVGKVEAAKGQAEEMERSLAYAINSLEISGDVSDEVADVAQELLNAVGGVLREAQAAAQSISASLEASLDVHGAVRRSEGELVKHLAAFDKDYSQVKERSSSHQSKLDELTRLEAEQHEAEELAQLQGKQRAALGDPAGIHVDLRAELSTVRRSRSDLLADECAALTESSTGLLKAKLSVGRGLDEARTRFKALISGSNVRATRVDSFFDQLQVESDPRATWDKVLEELEVLMLSEEDADIRSETAPTLTRLGLAVADLKRLAPRLTPDGWLDLSLTPLTDQPEFQYRSREGEYIPFSSASAGQQASALLTTLLSQSGPPLIIDQPEDDLDSDTVQRIVSRIWEAKSRRQLVFSSHNANLVVNGDADLVLVCAHVNAGDQSAGHICTQGSIDVQGVRDEITRVMEGGERAFRLRKEKYGF